MSQLTEQFNNLQLNLDPYDFMDLSDHDSIGIICNTMINDVRIRRFISCLAELDCLPISDDGNLINQVINTINSFKESIGMKVKYDEDNAFNFIIELHRRNNELSHQCGRFLLFSTPKMTMCFENYTTCIVYIRTNNECVLFEDIDVNELNLILFALCKIKKLSHISFPTKTKQEKHSIDFAFQIFKKINECLGMDMWLFESRVTRSSTNHPFFLCWWGRYAQTMISLTYMTISCYITHNLLYNGNLLYYVSNQKQVLMNEIRTLSVKPIPRNDERLPRQFRFDLLLRIPIPNIDNNIGKSFKHNAENGCNGDLDLKLQLTEKLMTELKLKILDYETGFPSCSCNEHKELLSQLRGENVCKFHIQRKLVSHNILFPMAKRTCYANDGRQTLEIYCVFITQKIMGGGFNPTWNKTFSSIRYDEMNKLVSVDTLDRCHFIGDILDINSRTLVHTDNSIDYISKPNYNYLNNNGETSKMISNQTNDFVPISICSNPIRYESDNDDA